MYSDRKIETQALDSPSPTRWPLHLLRAPISLESLTEEEGALVTPSGRRFPISPSGIPLFASEFCSDDARKQGAHYDEISAAYLANLSYPHTQEYMGYLDRVFLATLPDTPIGVTAELCCGRGEAFCLMADRVSSGIGIDVSTKMLEAAMQEHSRRPIYFVQGDATMLPLATESVDAVCMLGGVHHVRDRRALFGEIARILKPSGRFYWREPVSDFFLWRWLRSLIYKVSPLLDAETERPLTYEETVPVLQEAGLSLVSWKTYGFLGFCLFMNSDVLVFNRLFRFLPGIRALTRMFIRIDDLTGRLPGLQRGGLQVVGVAEKPARLA